MGNSKREGMPIAVMIVSGLYLLAGVAAIFDVLEKLLRNHISINFAVCLLFVGIGLLRGKRRSRGWATCWLVIAAVMGLLLVGLALAGVSGVVLRPNPPIAYGLALAMFGLLYWIYRVLWSPQGDEWFNR